MSLIILRFIIDPLDIGLKLQQQGYNYNVPSSAGGRPSNGNGGPSHGGQSHHGGPSHGGPSHGGQSHHGGPSHGSNGGGSRKELGGGGGSLFKGISSYDAPLVSGSPYNGGGSQDFGVPSAGGANFGNQGPSSGSNDFQQGNSHAIDLGGGPVTGPAPVFKQVFQQGEPTITKNFYVHESPDDEDNAEVQDKIKEVKPQKNYKIIFIKAPTYGAYGSGGRYPNFPLVRFHSKAFSLRRSLTLFSLPQSEEKTIVYVLSKKHNDDDANDPNNTPAPPVTSKPEVFFVKYKTKEEAAEAVAKIQGKSSTLALTSKRI